MYVISPLVTVRCLSLCNQASSKKQKQVLTSAFCSHLEALLQLISYIRELTEKCDTTDNICCLTECNKAAGLYLFVEWPDLIPLHVDHRPGSTLCVDRKCKEIKDKHTDTQLKTHKCIRGHIPGQQWIAWALQLSFPYAGLLWQWGIVGHPWGEKANIIWP